MSDLAWSWLPTYKIDNLWVLAHVDFVQEDNHVVDTDLQSKNNDTKVKVDVI